MAIDNEDFVNYGSTLYAKEGEYKYKYEYY